MYPTYMYIYIYIDIYIVSLSLYNTYIYLSLSLYIYIYRYIDMYDIHMYKCPSRRPRSESFSFRAWFGSPLDIGTSLLADTICL